ncbi:MAG: LysR substrate-binding domain-containing protein, partial [Rhodomicrobium sp.]
ERGRTGVVPTALGSALLHHARIVLRQIEEMHCDLGEYSKGFRRHIRLLANTAAMTEFLPGPLATYLASRPNVDIELTERPSLAIVKAVEGGFADIGIISDTADFGALHLFPFAIDRLVLVVPKESPLAARRRVAFREVASHPFVGLSAGSALQTYLAERAVGISHPLSYRIHLNTFEAVCRMVEHDVGLAIMPQSVAGRCGKRMAICMVGLSDTWAIRHHSLCVRKLDTLSPHARELAEHLIAPGANRN